MFKKRITTAALRTSRFNFNPNNLLNDTVYSYLELPEDASAEEIMELVQECIEKFEEDNGMHANDVFDSVAVQPIVNQRFQKYIFHQMMDNIEER